MKVIGHIPDILPEVIYGLMLVWEALQVTAKFDGNIEVHHGGMGARWPN